MKVALLSNLSKQMATECTEKVINEFFELGIKVYMQGKVYNEYFSEFQYITPVEDFFDLLEECDMVCAIGGDGTIIHIAKYAAKASKPILGINLGRVGFLADVEPSKLDELQRLSNEEYSIEERMMIDVEIKTKTETKKLTALNDVVISKEYPTKMINIDMFNNDDKINNYHCDGVVVATPTGSTAYSLSAGGPIVDPKCECMIITPICPHVLTSRSLIMDFKSNIRIEPKFTYKEENVFLNIDGDKTIKLNEDDVVNVSVSGCKAKFIKIKDTNFFRTLNYKLTEG